MTSPTKYRRMIRRRYVQWNYHKTIRFFSLVLIMGITIVSLSQTIRSFFHPLLFDGIKSRGGVHLRGRRDYVWVHNDSQLFNERSLAAQATDLIIVAGHSVLISGNVESAPFDESVWYLLDYQRNKGLPYAIVSHIQTGIKLALENEKSLLVFSGGETRAQTGPDTEGASYFRVADALDLWSGRNVFLHEKNEYTIDRVTKSLGFKGDNDLDVNLQSTVRARTITEEYATDSFENLMFSICRFHDITGSYPMHISLVSFSFKQKRFESLHAAALRWPLSHFNFVGVDPPSFTGFDLQEAMEGETANSLLPFQSDPYGCHTEVLQKKRKERNPFARKAPYELTCPEMKELLNWCGPTYISEDKVPWEL